MRFFLNWITYMIISLMVIGVPTIAYYIIKNNYWLISFIIMATIASVFVAANDASENKDSWRL